MKYLCDKGIFFSNLVDPPARSGLPNFQVTAGGLFVFIEMSLGFLATVLNVIVLATIKNSHSLLSQPRYVLLANLAASNIATSILVKLMSVVLCGHAVATHRTQVRTLRSKNAMLNSNSNTARHYSYISRSCAF